MLEESAVATAQMNPIRQRIVDFKEAERVRASGLYPYFRPITSAQDTEVVLEGQKVLMFGSNSYMGLTNHPKVKEAALAAVKKYGTGCAGSRFLNGTLDLHLECEAKLAQFVGKEGALLYSTGFQVNQGVIACLLGRSDCVILDKSDHASIVEGANLSLGKVARFRHNDVAGLRHVLEHNAGNGGKLIVVDGVYSMEGDIAPLPEIVALAEEFDALVMVDDAHGIGVLGPQGRGTCAHFGLTDKVDLIMGTFSKSLASLGGFIAAEAVTIDYLKHHSRALIFSASLPPANVAAVIAAVDIILAEPERIKQLWDNTRRMSDGLRALGFNIGHSATPIIPVCIGDDFMCFKVCRMLQEAGVFVNPVVSPAVEPGNALIRVSLMATHTFAQIDVALEKFAGVGRALGLIS